MMSTFIRIITHESLLQLAYTEDTEQLSRFRVAWEKGFRGIVAAVYADILQDHEET